MRMLADKVCVLFWPGRREDGKNNGVEKFETRRNIITPFLTLTALPAIYFGREDEKTARTTESGDVRQKEI